MCNYMNLILGAQPPDPVLVVSCGPNLPVFYLIVSIIGGNPQTPVCRAVIEAFTPAAGFLLVECGKFLSIIGWNLVYIRKS